MELKNESIFDGRIHSDARCKSFASAAKVSYLIK